MTVHAATQFSIDSTGAYLLELHDSFGKPIVFPRTQLGDKVRGGSHVCLPAFGPDASGKLPQHGYGREVEWDIVTSPDGRTVQCEHTQREGLYAGLQSRIMYQLDESVDSSVLQTTLSLFNQSIEPMPISPGFHPYFVVDPADIQLNGQRIALDDFEPFKSYGRHQSMTLETAGRTVTVSSPDIQDFIVWSDSRGEYLCIEPTLAGSGFDYIAPRAEELLPAGERRNFSYSVQW
jgi:galactose mutarotase-like enzyme